WGWTVFPSRQDRDEAPSPTHVGMDREACALEGAELTEPHARGDGPTSSRVGERYSSRAPRTWGWTDRDLRGRTSHDPSPTHAGMKSFCDSTRSPRGASGCWFQQIFAIPQKMSEADHMVLLQRLISLQGGSR